MRPPPSPSRIGALGAGPTPVGSHAKGVSLMEAGNWDGAVKAFGQALDNARGDACTKEAQYLAAVRLLKASACTYCPQQSSRQLLTSAHNVNLCVNFNGVGKMLLNLDLH